MTLCRSHGLYDGIIYVHTRAMNDYIAPIQELMATLREALQSGRPLTDGQVLLGNKLLVYIRYRGRFSHCPSGVGRLD